MKRKENFIVKSVGDRRFLFSADDSVNCIFAMNDTCNFIWELLSSNQSVDSIAQAIVKEYSIEKEIAVNDVKDIIEIMHEAGAIYE